MSYREPLATASAPGIVRPGTNLTVSDGVLNVTPVALFDQAYFYSTVTQTNPIASQVNKVTFNNAAINVGITLVSATQITVSKTANYTLDMAANSYVEMCWSCPDIAVQLTALPATVGPIRPATPSAKITLTRIS